jgi:major membrane immunogen (membrane-anchored lipoprotein)
MHKFVYGVALAAMAAVMTVSAAQAKDLFAVAYGNTVTQTMPNGTKLEIYVNKDHSWEQKMPDGKMIKGTYMWKDAHTACFTVTDPAPKDASKATNCNTIKGEHKVGESWTEEMPNHGGKISMTITAGRAGM